VQEDDRFEPNPKATRPFCSLVSVPLRINEDTVGAFTVISTRKNAFGPTTSLSSSSSERSSTSF
jgi:hypothetical protein